MPSSHRRRLFNSAAGAELIRASFDFDQKTRNQYHCEQAAAVANTRWRLDTNAAKLAFEVGKAEALAEGAAG